MPSSSPSSSQDIDQSVFLGLPEFSQISNERSRLGDRGLNRMNQISATILNRLSQDAAEPEVNLDQINVNNFPAQIRNLGPLNRRFLDLSLNMNLNEDTLISPSEYSQTNATQAGIASYPGFSSEDSDSDTEYIEPGSSRHDDDDHSDDNNSADFDSSDSAVSTEDNDTETRVEADNARVDNRASYYTSFLSYSNGHRFLPHVSMDSVRSILSPSISAPHRLLLSSARQNTTNQNTLVNTRFSPRDYESNSGVSLRRQNAIRVKPNRYSSQKMASMASSLYEDFKGAFAAIRRENPFSGKLPLFEDHGCCIQPSDLAPCTEHQERRSPLKCKMTSFLRLRRHAGLWDSHADSLQIETETTKATSSSSVLKRRSSVSEASAAKRRRISRSEVSVPRSNERVDLKLGDHINAAALSSRMKSSILDGLPCSFMKDGSVFTMKVINLWAPKSGTDSVSITFSQVCFAEKFLHGCFDLQNNPNFTEGVHDVTSFLGFLCGGSRSHYNINNANGVIQSKFKLLNDLCMAMIVDLGILNSKILKTLGGAMQIPFSGEIIDFKKHDLRFLGEKSGRSLPRTRGISSRIENERVKLQINEWLNIKPFCDYSETFFMNYLYFTELNLRKFSSIALSEQQASLDFAQSMKDSIFHLSKNFPSVQAAKIPIIESKSRQAQKDLRQRRRREPRSNLRKTSFMKDWEAKVCEKLCDHITCGDTCLLNLQLNYILFTVRVDISAEIDKVFNEFLNLISKDSERATLEKKYKALCKYQLPPEATDAVFVCSLNRKTGTLEMHNTRSHLDFKYSSTGQFIDLPSLAGDGPPSDDSFGEALFSAHPNTHFSEDPSLMAVPCILRGKARRGAAGSFSQGGGSAPVDFI